MKKKNKGFTLLELLAVIIILAVIALIAVPIILDIINDSKASAEESSVAYYASSVELTYAENMVNDTKVDLRSGADSKTSGVKVVCETVGYLEGRGVVLDKCTVGSTISYNKLIDTVKAETLYYYLDKQVFTERPIDMDSVIASLDEDPINPPDKPSLTGDKIGDKVLEKFPNLALSNTEAKGCAISDNNYTYMGGCYLSGAQDKNYIWFSGFLYRIMGINKDGSIRLITEENVTSIPYHNTSSNFTGSYAESWLNEYFISNLKGTDKIIENKFCQGATSSTLNLQRTNCTGGTEITNKVGLLSIDEYNLAGSVDSYLSTKQTFWSISPSNDTKLWYFSSSGKATNYGVDAIFGFRPIINLSSLAIITAGDGSLNDHFILNQDKFENIKGNLNENISSGEYVLFAGKNYRIIGKNSDGTTKLILDSYYQEIEGINYTVAYGTNNTFLITRGIGKKLNGDVLNWLVPNQNDKDKLVMNASWYQNLFERGNSYKESIKENTTPIPATVGLINVGEMLYGQSISILTKNYTVNNNFSNAASYWSLTPFSSVSNAWAIYDYGTANSLSVSSMHALRPVININDGVIIIRGNGTFSNPYEI